MSNTFETFWLVWNPDRLKTEHQHASLQDAVAEATRVAHLESGGHRNTDIYVLQAISRVRNIIKAEQVYEESTSA